MKLDLMRLFDGYVKSYHTFNLTIHHGKHSFTMVEIEHFSRLGSMMGYHTFTEDTSSGNNRPMDLSWWADFDGEYWNDFVLHLERENLFSKDEETLEKLFSDREYTPSNVIAIMNVRNKARIDELIDMTNEMCNIKNALLIFKTTSSGKSQSYFDIVHAYSFKRGKVTASKIAYVTEVHGTLFMHFEDKLV